MQIHSRCRNTNNSVLTLILLILLVLSITSCEQKTAAVAAPLNDIGTLEKLAAAYEQISEQFPVSPVSLAPKARKKFVEQVFEAAGYGYSETLDSLAKVKPDEITKLHRDMQELLFLPHHGLSTEVEEQIYNEQQQKAIKKIKSVFR